MVMFHGKLLNNQHNNPIMVTIHQVSLPDRTPCPGMPSGAFSAPLPGSRGSSSPVVFPWGGEQKTGDFWGDFSDFTTENGDFMGFDY